MDHVHRKQGFLEEKEGGGGGGGDQMLVLIDKPSSSSLQHSFDFMGSSFGTRFDLGPEDKSRTLSDQNMMIQGNHASIEKEHMFDKVLTPSDVGKLNRLVIPKKHAEKCFPLDSFTNQKGLLLNFEDREGKLWRFRYLYWNSSQSYVMTKGWSRFVKDRKLDAGDVVSFQRGVGDETKDSLFIDWQRRRLGDDGGPRGVFTRGQYYRYFHASQLLYPHGTAAATVARDWMQLSLLGNANIDIYANNTYNIVGGTRHRCGGGLNMVYFRPNTGGAVGSRPRGSVGSPVVFRSVPLFQARNKAAAPKTLRLFGVNMECPVLSDQPDEVLSSTLISHASLASHQPPNIIIGPSSPRQQPYKISQLRFYNGKPLMMSCKKDDNQASTSKSLSMSF